MARRHIASWVILAAATAGVPPARSAPPATNEVPLEYKVKAAFILNFTKFIQWPQSAFASADSPFTICIAGKDPFGNVLDSTVAGETVEGRSIVVKRMPEIPPGPGCHVVYADVPAKDIPAALNRLGEGVLTVGEGEVFARNGGVIAFVIQDRRVRFDINPTAADAVHLKLSSRLVSVARAVRNDPRPEQ